MTDDKTKGQKGGGAIAQPTQSTTTDDHGRRLSEEFNKTDEDYGEQSMSGSTPDPTADDDTLEAAHAVGEQLNEDEEHPEELDIARDVDQAEEEIRNK